MWVGCAYLVVHGLLALLLPESQEAWSTLCIVLAELAALFACLYTARSSGTPSRTLWRLLALSIFFHAIAMSMDMYAEYMGIAMTLSPGIQILCSTLYAVPLLFAVSMQFDARTPRPVHIVNACLALATAALFYVLVFSVVSRVGSNNPADLYYLSRLFDVLDLFLAIAATIRAAEADLKDSGRVVIRYSGTEALARVMIEAESEAAMHHHATTIADAIRNELGA